MLKLLGSSFARSGNSKADIQWSSVENSDVHLVQQMKYDKLSLLQNNYIIRKLWLLW